MESFTILCNDKERNTTVSTSSRESYTLVVTLPNKSKHHIIECLRCLGSLAIHSQQYWQSRARKHSIQRGNVSGRQPLHKTQHQRIALGPRMAFLTILSELSYRSTKQTSIDSPAFPFSMSQFTWTHLHCQNQRSLQGSNCFHFGFNLRLLTCKILSLYSAE